MEHLGNLQAAYSREEERKGMADDYEAAEAFGKAAAAAADFAKTTRRMVQHERHNCLKIYHATYELCHQTMNSYHATPKAVRQKRKKLRLRDIGCGARFVGGGFILLERC
jgi:hypothetical protein